MLKHEIIIKNGIKFKLTYSDIFKIQKTGTEEVYCSASDVIDSTNTYDETNIPLPVIPEGVDLDGN